MMNNQDYTDMAEQKNYRVAYDCKYFLGDRPCTWHKIKGVLCECNHYTPLQERLLIIKLDAIGDVLRTTCLLPVIAKKWPSAGISWITRYESVPLLQNNPYITEVIPYDADALVHLASHTFDHVINLDSGRVSAGMAAMAKGKEKIGYILNENGYVTATNAAADHWLHLGLFDDNKKENIHTYQEIMCSILRLPAEGLKYVLELTEEEREKGRSHLLDIGINLKKSIIGIHTGGGGRWRLKQWNEQSFVQLITELLNQSRHDIQICLFGGPLEKELNKRIAKRIKGTLFNTGCENTLRHSASLIRQCSVILSGDSLAMHLALAMERRVVVLFGPTSHAEIELFGLGEKVLPDLDCLVCYKKECDFIPNCMESISVAKVKEALLRQLDFIN